MNERTFMKCNICGNVIEVINNSGVKPVCCSKQMEVLKPNTVDASQEKHVPDVERNNNEITVKIGSTEHPMIPEHYICWILVAQGNSTWRVDLKPGEKPIAKFNVNDGGLRVYEYCNIHGLWLKDLK